MNAFHPILKTKRDSAAQKGLTLLEMMVAVALLSVIVLGLTAMFLQTQRAFKSGLKQIDVFEGGRSIMSMLTRDLEQMADAESPDITNFWVSQPQGGEFIQYQSTNNSAPIEFRINYLHDIYSLSKVGRTWTAIGYAVSNTLPSGGFSGVGTLYRYTVTTNALRPDVGLFTTFTNRLISMAHTNFHRVADGVIHLQVRAFDYNGIEVYDWPLAFPCVNTNNIVTTNLPAYLELELGMIEPETLKQAMSMGDRASDFLKTNRVNKVHIFRQQIPIRAALR